MRVNYYLPYRFNFANYDSMCGLIFALTSLETNHRKTFKHRFSVTRYFKIYIESLSFDVMAKYYQMKIVHVVQGILSFSP